MCKNIYVCVYTHICLYFQKEKVNNNLPGYLHGKRDYMGWRDTNSSWCDLLLQFYFEDT